MAHHMHCIQNRVNKYPEGRTTLDSEHNKRYLGAVHMSALIFCTAQYYTLPVKWWNKCGVEPSACAPNICTLSVPAPHRLMGQTCGFALPMHPGKDMHTHNTETQGFATVPYRYHGGRPAVGPRQLCKEVLPGHDHPPPPRQPHGVREADSWKSRQEGGRRVGGRQLGRRGCERRWGAKGGSKETVRVTGLLGSWWLMRKGSHSEPGPPNKSIVLVVCLPEPPIDWFYK